MKFGILDYFGEDLFVFPDLPPALQVGHSSLLFGRVGYHFQSLALDIPAPIIQFGPSCRLSRQYEPGVR